MEHFDSLYIGVDDYYKWGSWVELHMGLEIVSVSFCIYVEEWQSSQLKWVASGWVIPINWGLTHMNHALGPWNTLMEVPVTGDQAAPVSVKFL